MQSQYQRQHTQSRNILTTQKSDITNITSAPDTALQA
jgi:hypothetical protein